MYTNWTVEFTWPAAIIIVIYHHLLVCGLWFSGCIVLLLSFHDTFTAVSCMLCWHWHCYVLSSVCRYVMLLSHKDMYQYETQRAGLVHLPIKEISGCRMMMCLISEGRYVPCKLWVFVVVRCDTALLVFWRRVHEEIICLWTLNTCKRWQHIPLKCVEPRTHWCSITSQMTRPLKLLFHCTIPSCFNWLNSFWLI